LLLGQYRALVDLDAVEARLHLRFSLLDAV